MVRPLRTMAVRFVRLTASASAADTPYGHCRTGPNRRTSKPAAAHRVFLVCGHDDRPGPNGHGRPDCLTSATACPVALVEKAGRAVVELAPVQHHGRWFCVAALLEEGVLRLASRDL
jgi:hypothetical protein